MEYCKNCGHKAGTYRIKEEDIILHFGCVKRCQASLCGCEKIDI